MVGFAMLALALGMGGADEPGFEVSEVRSSGAGDVRVEVANLRPDADDGVLPRGAARGEVDGADGPLEAGVRAVAVPTVTAAPGLGAGAECCFVATRYGESYEGQTLGCPGGFLPAGRGDKLYHSADAQILAAPPGRDEAWPCGTRLLITNPGTGVTLLVYRMDACPGCDEDQVDLSEAAIALLAGTTYPAELVDRLEGLYIEEVGK